MLTDRIYHLCVTHNARTGHHPNRLRLSGRDYSALCREVLAVHALTATSESDSVGVYGNMAVVIDNDCAEPVVEYVEAGVDGESK